MVRRPLWFMAWLLALAASACGNDASVDFGAGDGDAGNGTDQTDGSDASDPLDDGTDPSESDAPGDTASPTSPAAPPRTPAKPGSGVDAGEPVPTATPAPPPNRPGDFPDNSSGEATPRPGQANVHARAWESAEVQSDDVTVQVTYWTGVEPCHVLDRVEVREEAMTVTITLYEGSQPGFDGACTAQAVERWTTVKLSAPLKGRVIVDGAAKTEG